MMKSLSALSRHATAALFATLLLLAGCDPTGDPSQDGDAHTSVDGAADGDTADPTGAADATGQGDLGRIGGPDGPADAAAGDSPSAPTGGGAFGSPCSENLDCFSGWCVPTSLGSSARSRATVTAPRGGAVRA